MDYFMYGFLGSCFMVLVHAVACWVGYDQEWNSHMSVFYFALALGAFVGVML